MAVGLDVAHVVERVLKRAVAAARRVAVDVHDAEQLAVSAGERIAANFLRPLECHVVVTHDRFAHPVRQAAGRLEIGPRPADEPRDLEGRVGLENVVVGQGNLQEQVRIGVAAEARTIAHGVLIVVYQGVWSGECPGVAVRHEPALRVRPRRRRTKCSGRQLLPQRGNSDRS